MDLSQINAEHAEISHEMNLTENPHNWNSNDFDLRRKCVLKSHMRKLAYIVALENFLVLTS